MISEIKTLTDLIIRLFSERQKNRDQIINSIVTPAYETTKGIVDSYRELLTKAAAQATNKNEFNVIVETLLDIRNSYITERQAILAIAETASDKWDDDNLKRFADLLRWVFFDDKDGPLYGGMRSFGKNAICYLESYVEGEIPSKELGQLLERMQFALDRNWERLSSAYAELRVPKA